MTRTFCVTCKVRIKQTSTRVVLVEPERQMGEWRDGKQVTAPEVEDEIEAFFQTLVP